MPPKDSKGAKIEEWLQQHMKSEVEAHRVLAQNLYCERYTGGEKGYKDGKEISLDDETLEMHTTFVISKREAHSWRCRGADCHKVFKQTPRNRLQAGRV